ncbi:MAG: YchJ family metal-binding protein [Gammaproteobacteria bacterium]|nr:YchJ family metal-binding protein [Gammaproteobacteria bacterium]MDH5728192.1 YchJ family metal-binding protein [Gammaproteobacteria bacterium]
MSLMQVCPCGSGKQLVDCCGQYLFQSMLPGKAEILMRSRYSAYVLGENDYLLQTWHTKTRPKDIAIDRNIVWTGLQIIEANTSSDSAERAWVGFVASYEESGRSAKLAERSEFVFENHQWFYLKGEPLQQARVQKLSRNSLCACGSGKKFKRCCGA